MQGFLNTREWGEPYWHFVPIGFQPSGFDGKAIGILYGGSVTVMNAPWLITIKKRGSMPHTDGQFRRIAVDWRRTIHRHAWGTSDGPR